MTIKFTGKDYQRELKKLFEREEVKAYTMTILSLFALSFFTLFAIRPTLATLFSLRRQISDSREVDHQLELKINTLLQAQETLQKEKDNLFLLDEALPSDPQFTVLVRELETLARDNEATLAALQVESFNFQGKSDVPKKAAAEKKVGNEPESFNFSLRLSADYLRLKNFLNQLMSLKRIVTIRDFAFTQERNQAISLEIKAQSYYNSAKDDGKNNNQ